MSKFNRIEQLRKEKLLSKGGFKKVDNKLNLSREIILSKSNIRVKESHLTEKKNSSFINKMINRVFFLPLWLIPIAFIYEMAGLNKYQNNSIQFIKEINEVENTDDNIKEKSERFTYISDLNEVFDWFVLNHDQVYQMNQDQLSEAAKMIQKNFKTNRFVQLEKSKEKENVIVLKVFNSNETLMDLITVDEKKLKEISMSTSTMSKPKVMTVLSEDSIDELKDTIGDWETNQLIKQKKHLKNQVEKVQDLNRSKITTSIFLTNKAIQSDFSLIHDWYTINKDALTEKSSEKINKELRQLSKDFLMPIKVLYKRKNEHEIIELWDTEGKLIQAFATTPSGMFQALYP